MYDNLMSQFAISRLKSEYGAVAEAKWFNGLCCKRKRIASLPALFLERRKMSIEKLEIWKCDECGKEANLKGQLTCWPDGFIKFQYKTKRGCLPEYLACSTDCILKILLYDNDNA